MSFKTVAVACVGAALSLAVASFGASAADYTPMKPLQPAPAPPPPLDIHGFFDVTFANDYITPRGLLVTNTGLTTQIVNGLTFSLYKDPNTWINSFSITAGTFNDLWSKQDNVTVGSWNEFDWWVSADWTVAKYWKTGVTYITFLSPPGNFRQERNVEPYIRFDDGALTGWAFTINAYVKLFYAIAGDSTVVVGNQGDTYDVEIGMVPTLDLKKITGVPLTLAAPTWVTVGPTSYWNRGITGCGLITTAPCSLSNAGVFTTGLALRETMDWLIPDEVGQLVRQGRLPVLPHHQRQPATGSDHRRHRKLLRRRAPRGVGRLCRLGLHVLSFRQGRDVQRTPLASVSHALRAVSMARQYCRYAGAAMCSGGMVPALVSMRSTRSAPLII